MQGRAMARPQEEQAGCTDRPGWQPSNKAQRLQQVIEAFSSSARTVFTVFMACYACVAMQLLAVKAEQCFCLACL